MGQVETGQGRDNNPLQWGPWRSCMPLWFRKFRLMGFLPPRVPFFQGIMKFVHLAYKVFDHFLGGLLTWS